MGGLTGDGAGRGDSGVPGPLGITSSQTPKAGNQEPLAPGDNLSDTVFSDFPGARSVLEFLVCSSVCKEKNDQPYETRAEA